MCTSKEKFENEILKISPLTTALKNITKYMQGLYVENDITLQKEILIDLIVEKYTRFMDSRS